MQVLTAILQLGYYLQDRLGHIIGHIFMFFLIL